MAYNSTQLQSNPIISKQIINFPVTVRNVFSAIANQSHTENKVPKTTPGLKSPTTTSRVMPPARSKKTATSYFPQQWSRRRPRRNQARRYHSLENRSQDSKAFSSPLT